MPATIAITRRLEFDAGHRLPNHKSQCRNVHGHRYALEITLSSEVIHEEGAADDGMVMDFGDIKRIANEKLVDLWDHAFLVYRGDKVMVDFLAAISGHKTVILDVVPPGLLRRDAERAWELFQDPKNCAVVLVTLPEEMPTTETIELAHALEHELHLPIGKIVVNCVLPPLFSKEERITLEAADAKGDIAITSGRSRAVREHVQAHALARLAKELPVSPSFLPQLFIDAAQPSAIRELAKRLG